MVQKKQVRSPDQIERFKKRNAKKIAEKWLDHIN
jgi:hypothetical protein